MESSPYFVGRKGQVLNFRSPWGTAQVAGGRVTFTCEANGRTYRSLEPQKAVQMLAKGLPLGYIIQRNHLVE